MQQRSPRLPTTGGLLKIRLPPDSRRMGHLGMSVLPQKRTNSGQSRYVRLVPKADVCTAAKRRAAYRHCGAKLNTDDCRYAGCGTHASSLRYAWQEAL